jgi:ribosome maturation factor RimP
VSLKLAFQGRKHYRGVLEALGEGWRLVLKSNTKGTADQALDFSLDEVKDARLVPVVDFKGRRFLPAANPQGDEATAADVDGDRKQ